MCVCYQRVIKHLQHLQPQTNLPAEFQIEITWQFMDSDPQRSTASGWTHFDMIQRIRQNKKVTTRIYWVMFSQNILKTTLKGHCLSLCGTPTWDYPHTHLVFRADWRSSASEQWSLERGTLFRLECVIVTCAFSLTTADLLQQVWISHFCTNTELHRKDHELQTCRKLLYTN